MATPEEHLQILKVAKDYTTLSDTLQFLMNGCPAEYFNSFKIKLANILREKQLLETKQAQGHQRALQDIDLKYKNLAVRLSQAVPTASPRNNLPVKNSSSLAGIGATVIKNWIQARQKQLLGFGVALGAVGSLAFIFNKFYGSNNSNSKSIKNPDEVRDKKFEGFEKTLTALQKLRSLNKISKNASFDDYQGFLSGKKKKKSDDDSYDSKRLIDWSREESHLMSSADKAVKALSNFKLPTPELPLLTTSAEFGESENKKPRRKRKEKEVIESDENSDVDNAEPDIEEIEIQEEHINEEPSDLGRLIPIVKRTKRVKKIS